MQGTVTGDRYSKAACTKGGMRSVMTEMSMNSEYFLHGTEENSIVECSQWISNPRKTALSAASLVNNTPVLYFVWLI